MAGPAAATDPDRDDEAIVLTLDEAAAELQRTRPQIKHLIEDGRLHAIRYGPRSPRIERREIERFKAEEENLLSTQAAARRIRVSTSTLDRLHREGEISPVWRGKRRYWRRDDLDDLVRRHGGDAA